MLALPAGAQRLSTAPTAPAARPSAPPPRMYTGLKTRQRASVGSATGGRAQLNGYPTVFEVEKASPAARAGFRVGDEIVAVNGFDVVSARERAILRGPGQTNTVQVRRGPALLTLTITPTAPRARVAVVKR